MAVSLLRHGCETTHVVTIHMSQLLCSTIFQMVTVQNATEPLQKEPLLADKANKNNFKIVLETIVTRSEILGVK